MWVKRPVNKQPSADQVLHRDWSPIAAVVAVITVVTHGEKTVTRHRVSLIGVRPRLVPGRITAIRRSRRHPPLEPITLRLFPVDVEKRWIDAQLVAGQTGQSLNVKRRSGNRIGANPRDNIFSEDKNIPAVRLNQVG